MIALSEQQPLPRSFFGQRTDEVARRLIGCRLCHRDGGTLRVGRIVETEAYLGPADRACHSSRGRTARTEVMFGAPGHAYVYLIYGMHCCFNVVTREEGIAEAVLVRGVEPLEGCLGEADGPGKLCRALAIDRSLNGADLLADALWILPPDPRRPAGALAKGRRVGVEYAGAWANRLLRFWEKDSSFVSSALGARGRRSAGRKNRTRGMRGLP